MQETKTVIVGARIPSGVKEYLTKKVNLSRVIQNFLFEYIENKEGKEVLAELCGDTKMYRDYKFYKET